LRKQKETGNVAAFNAGPQSCMIDACFTENTLARHRCSGKEGDASKMRHVSPTINTPINPIIIILFYNVVAFP
jgi:hypothetical protein